MRIGRRALLLGLALPAPDEIVVSASASLRDVLLELAPRFRDLAAATARFNFGASGVLQKQIEAGAPVDVFVSAGNRQMDGLQAAGLIDAATRRVVARNALVLVVPTGGSVVRHFAELEGNWVRRLAIGNPKTVPAGEYARQILVHMGFWEALSSRLVFGGDVRQVLEYVARGEVDAGIVYATDARIARGRVSVSERAPDSSHDPVLYPAAVVSDSRRRNAAVLFVQLMASQEGARVFSRHGFLPAGGR